MKKEKVLILASVASMIQQFNLNNINILLQLGYKVEVACNFKNGNTCSKESIEELKKTLDMLNVDYYQIDFSRNILNFKDLVLSLRKLLSIVRGNNYKFIHCHSPIGGVCGRIVGALTKTKIIYTAHGFHFYQGAPIKNWIIFYNIEKFLSQWTDILITINTEDYEIAKKFYAKQVMYVPGIGMEIKKDEKNKFNNIREEFKITKNEIIFLSVGELNKNKNHEIVIKSLAKLSEKNFKYIICGIGNRREYLEKLAEKMGIKENVIFSGFRDDVDMFYEIADVFIFPSFREGLSVSLMEAMSFGLPVVCSDIRGNKDLIKKNLGGFLFNSSNEEELCLYMERLYKEKSLRHKFGEFNKKEINKFSIDVVSKMMFSIYESMGADYEC